MLMTSVVDDKWNVTRSRQTTWKNRLSLFRRD